MDPKKPEAPQNRRISIIVMNRDAENRVYHTAPEGDQPEENPLVAAMPVPAKAFVEAPAAAHAVDGDQKHSRPSSGGR
jgi:hypothetical protein